jgi:hypothetical protein
MRNRTTAHDLDAQGVRALTDALARLNIDVTADSISVPGGQPHTVDIVGASRVTAPVRHTLTAPTAPGTTRVVVADAIDHAARQMLNDAGVSWFDRRGMLKITLPGIVVDADIESDERLGRQRASEQPVRGRSGLTVAVDALRNATQDEPPSGMRALSRATGIPLSSLTASSRQLSQFGILALDRPAGQELFWATAQVWRPIWQPLTTMPTPDTATALLAGDTLAAVHYGVPIGVTKTYPWDLYAPDDRVAGLVMLRHQGDGPVVARIAVIPTPAALEHPTPGRPFNYVHPIVAALDLAADPSRGAEAINDWHPERITRVW